MKVHVLKYAFEDGPVFAVFVDEVMVHHGNVAQMGSEMYEWAYGLARALGEKDFVKVDVPPDFIAAIPLDERVEYWEEKDEEAWNYDDMIWWFDHVYLKASPS